MAFNKVVLIFFRRMRALIRQPVFIFITIWGHAAIIVGTLGFYYFEKGANPKVQSLFDTFYWAIANVTTVGYSESWPITTGGKLIGIALMIWGSLFLWSYTALFVGNIVAPEVQIVDKEIRSLGKEVKEVEQGMKIDEKLILELHREVQSLTQELRRRNK